MVDFLSGAFPWVAFVLILDLAIVFLSSHKEAKQSYVKIVSIYSAHYFYLLLVV